MDDMFSFFCETCSNSTSGNLPHMFIDTVKRNYFIRRAKSPSPNSYYSFSIDSASPMRHFCPLNARPSLRMTGYPSDTSSV